MPCIAVHRIQCYAVHTVYEHLQCIAMHCNIVNVHTLYALHCIALYTMHCYAVHTLYEHLLYAMHSSALHAMHIAYST